MNRYNITLYDILIALPDDAYCEVTKNNEPTLCFLLDRHRAKPKRGKTTKTIIDTVTHRELNRYNVSIHDSVISYEYIDNGIHRIKVQGD